MPSSVQSSPKKRPFLENVPLSEYSTLGIGGAARYLTHIETVEEAKQALLFAREKKLPFFVVGKGSNCLFDDRGFNGLIIVNKLQQIVFEEERVQVGGGYSFSLLGAQTARKGLAGLEFASGIPGTVGGAVFMNAGAGGHETKDSLVDVVFLRDDGQLVRYPKETLSFAYRTSPFQKMRGIIVEATFSLTPDCEAKERQVANVRYRMGTQPYSDKSAGCIFRNPEGEGAGALIDRCGLKGKRVGGAEVSPKHANFLVNREGATSEQFSRLISEVESEVYKQEGIKLIMEVKKVPYDIPR